MQRNRYQSVVQRTSDDAFRKGRSEHLRKEGENIEVQRVGHVTRTRGRQRVIRKPFFRQWRFLRTLRHTIVQSIRAVASPAKRFDAALHPTDAYPAAAVVPPPVPATANNFTRQTARPSTPPLTSTHQPPVSPRPTVNWTQAHLYGRDVAPPAAQPASSVAAATMTPTQRRAFAVWTQFNGRLTRGLEALALLEQALVAMLFRRPFLSIVSQADLTQKQVDGLNAFVPATIRLGLLGAIVLVMWWTWPSSQLPPALAAKLQQASGQSANALSSLAIVNPASFTNGDAKPLIVQAAAGPPILRPSPTSTIARALALQPAPADPAVQADVAAASLILVPTATAANVVMPPIVTVVPQVRLLPGVELKRSLAQASPTPTPTPTPTPEPVALDPGRLWSTFVPALAPDNDHYWVGRPFGNYATNQLASPSYQFGSTAGQRYRTHHGVDISNPHGTPVLAATDGEVVHAGVDDTVLLGPYNNFYGNTVVIRLNRQLPVASGQMDVYLLYGHLSQVNVTVGQQVRPEDVIGAVGMTGIAIGPHLHVEIRLGSNTYYNNVNPYLWLAPLEGQGSVAVRVLTADGRTWPAAAISVVRFSSGVAAWARQIITYMDTENIGPDPAWGENGAMDGIPAGSYYVVGVVNGERVSAEISVRAGETTFVELRTKQ